MTETANDNKDTRSETLDERADRNWSDLMQELRVSQTGVQLLAAFLVTLPFQARFAQLDTFQQRWYLGLLALAFLTVGVTLSPVAIHRHLFQGGAKPDVVRAAHVMTGLALGLIALLLAGIAFLVVDVVVSREVAAVGGGMTLLIGLVLLVGIPRMVAQNADQST
ncbi:DUF6328 family protein [Nocardioides sp.]|uniref:DUF6328 family protein n=1 Tax=Nocardioides sp. TaxID=35761 RepID=UPI002BD41197|nr:DUF6328 family protein [Nocardioides sp.]HXH80114.1 DUF6328 family protein [Nocardioides sp.]